MVKVHHTSKGIVPKRNLAQQSPEIGSIHNEPQHQDTYVKAKYPGDHQSQHQDTYVQAKYPGDHQPQQQDTYVQAKYPGDHQPQQQDTYVKAKYPGDHQSQHQDAYVQAKYPGDHQPQQQDTYVKAKYPGDHQPQQQDTYVKAKYPGDYQSQPPIKSWVSHERSHQQRPVSVISSEYNDFSSNDRHKYSKTKPKNKNDESSKIWKIVLVTTVIPLTLAAIGISIYGLVAAKMSTTMSTTTTTITTTTAPSLPPQCFAYAIIIDATRLSTAAGGGASDSGFFSGTYTWYRFNGTGGTAIPQFPPSYSRCGGVYPGWYAGPIPPYGYTSSGLVCYVYTSVCYYTNTILVANCGSYYVYGLINSPVVTGRYCTI